MYKFVVLAAVLACANAGGLIGAPAIATTYAAAPALATTYAAAPALAYGHAAPALAYGHAVAPAALTSQSSNILRSYGNLGQVSTYTKTIDTPYSSVRKSDVRVSNPGLATVAHAPLAYAAAPAVATYAHAAPVVAARAYAPAIAAAPAAYAHGPVLAARTAIAAPVAAHAGLLGVAYSAAPAVSHMTYANSYGIQYGW